MNVKRFLMEMFESGDDSTVGASYEDAYEEVILIEQSTEYGHLI